MKNYIIIIIWLISYPLVSLGQLVILGKCDRDINLFTQEEVDAFPENYGCTTIEGNLTIWGGITNDINNLSPLSGLTTITGNLIVQNTSQTFINGLSDLETIGGQLDISNNPNLTNLDGLASISSIGSNFFIEDNESLYDCCMEFCWNDITSGVVVIFNNNSGCNSISEINERCGNCSYDSSSTCTGDIVLTSQEDVDNFVVNYGCTIVDGNILIKDIQASGNPVDITNLSGLSDITYVSGDLDIENNGVLVDLSGLSNITVIGGDLNIKNNSILTNLSGLSNINAIGGVLNVLRNEALNDLFGISNITKLGGLIIKNNNTLTNMSGFSNIVSINGNLRIVSNDVLTNLSGLSGITFVGGNLEIGTNDLLNKLVGLLGIIYVGGDLVISNNNILTDLSGLSNITTLGGGLKIYGNDMLLDLSGLFNITTNIYGSLEISHNDLLTDLKGLSNILSVEDNLVIDRNNALIDLSDISNIRSIGGNLSIYYNYLLNSCCEVQCLVAVTEGDISVSRNATGCKSLTEIENSCGVGNCINAEEDICTSTITLDTQEGVDNFEENYGCSVIEGSLFILKRNINSSTYINNLNGLVSIKEITGNLYITFNEELDHLNGLSNLTSVGGDLIIRDNDLIQNLSGLEALQNIGRNLLIYDNKKLSSFDGITSLTNIGRSFEISDNPNLSDLSGLETLQDIGNNLSVYDNVKLSSFDGITSLTNIEGALQISYNRNLSDLSGLSDIQSIGSIFVIANPILSACCELECLLNIAQGFNTIRDNASGCNSISEIQENCMDFGCQSNSELNPLFSIDGICESSSIKFTNTTQGDASQFEWDFGDGTTTTTFSIDEAPEHTFEAGTYEITLTAISPDSQEYVYSETIDVFPTFKLNIKPLDTEEKDQYNVRKYAAVHYHLNVTDIAGEPIEGIKLRYKVAGSSLPNEIFESKISDENGMVDLNIKVSGVDLDSDGDDLLIPGFNAGTVLFHDAIVPESSLVGYCENYEIVENNFENFNIAVGEYVGSKKTYGLFGNRGYYGSLESEPEVTFAEIKGGAKLKGTVGARLALENEYDAFDLLSKSQFTIAGNLAGTGEIEGFATFNAGLGEQLSDFVMIPQVSIDASVGLNINAFVTGEIDFEQQISVGNQSLYMLYTFLELSTKGLSSSSVYYLRESLGAYFQNLDNVPLTLSYGGNTSLLLQGSGQQGFYPFKNKFMNVNIDASSLSGNTIYTMGYKNQLLNGTPTFKASYGLFSSHAYTPIDLNLGLDFSRFNLDLNFTTPYELGRGLEISGYLDKVNFQPLGGEMVFTNTDNKIINNIKRDIDYKSTFKFNQSAIDRVLVNNTAPFFSNSYLLGSNLNTLIETNESLFESEVNEIIESNIFDTAVESNSIHLKVNKAYEWEVDVELEIPLLKLKARSFELGRVYGLGVFSQIEFPLAEFSNSAESDKFLSSVTYPDKEELVDLKFDDFNAWWSKIQNYILEKADQIIETIIDFVQEGVTIVENELVDIYNDIRSIVIGKNGTTITFEDFSVLTFSYPDNGTVFNEGAKVSLNYFYPKGEVGGFTLDSIEFVVISDVFYLSAMEGNNTIYEAPNGNFNVNIQIGKDDLDYLGISETSIVELFYKGYDDLLWQSIKTGEGDISFNLIGEFALGVRLERENISPIVQLINLSSFEDDGYITATLEDDQSGIDWTSVLFLVNDSILSYERVGLTNEIRIDSDLLISGFSGENTLFVQGYDLQGNLGFDVATIDLKTGIEPFQFNNYLIDVYPNPTQSSVFFKIDTKGMEDLHFSILDINGKEVKKGNLSNQGYGLFNYKVDVDDLPNGIYELILIVNQDKLEAKKIIVQKL